jgi:diguanylate cyclase (GGDEF)-like protein/PAS domain S-box-containing protein
MTLFPAPAKTAPRRILVVEDEVLIAMDIQLQLQELGYAPVGLATRGEQAVEMAHALQPDLVLMDIQLSGKMDGIEAAQAIRVQLSVPVVFLTSFAADEILERAQFSEPYGYILKPFTEREIRTVIEMALYKHQADISLQNTITTLRDSAQHTQAILDNIVDAVITIDDHGRIESFNLSASAIFGYSAQEAIGQNVSILMPQPHQSQHDGYLQHYRATGENRIMGGTRELDGLRKDGTIFPLNLSVSKLIMAGKTTFIGLVLDLTQRRQDEESIRRLAYYDPLTDLPNRRLLLDYLRHAILASTRTGQRGAVMFLDLDHFKRVNDDLGHSAGDELLQQVAQRLQTSVREGDIVARVGGDEFVLVMEAMGLQDQEAASRAEAIANKVLQSLGQPYVLHGKTYTSTPSIGIMMFINDHESMEELLKKADSGMYQAKAAGRNRVRFFDPAVQAAATARSQLEEDLRQGLNRQEFLLHYQIQISADGRPIGVEALVRWQHAKQGMVSPAHFIPLAEETGLILPLGQWVLEAACHQLVAWSKTPATAPWTMAVNVSALQFAQSNFVAQVEWALHTTGASPLLLKLELTESMLVGDVDALIVKMNALKTLGVSFSLDDFGTGYSSLSYLKRLPLAQLKIDQSFVRDALTDPNDAVIAKTIVSLGHSLGLKVIAEGVETEGQRDFLIDIGCDSLQGYLFGRPTLPSLVWSSPG